MRPARQPGRIFQWDLAKKGRLVTMGKGDKLTNPIYEGDLAKVCVEAIHQTNAVIEVRVTPAVWA